MLSSELIKYLEQQYPLHWAEAWDSVGTAIMPEDREVSDVLLAVDPTPEVIAEAVDMGAQFLITHHPLLLRGTKSVTFNDAKGSSIISAIRGGLTLWCGHTNVDRSIKGTNAAIAELIGPFKWLKPLVPPSKDEDGLFGLGGYGELVTPTSINELAKKLKSAVPECAQGIRSTLNSDKPRIRTVAFCSGSGDSLLQDVENLGIDLYITSDLRHHPAQESINSPIQVGRDLELIDLAHFASEWLWLPKLAKQLTVAFPNLNVVVSKQNTDPFNVRF